MNGKKKIHVSGYLRALIRPGKISAYEAMLTENGDPDFSTEEPVRERTARQHTGFIRTRIACIKQIAPDVRTFTLTPEKGYAFPPFRTNQYASVKFTIDERAVTRPYAISSAPETAAADNRIDLTVRQKEGGYVSEFIWNHWRKGAEVCIDAPFGERFYSGIRDADHVIGIAGGCGIVSFRSMMRDMVDTGEGPKRLTLFYDAPDQDEMLFQHEMAAFASQSGGRIEIVRGSITADFIRRCVPDYADASFFLCGSFGLYDLVTKELDDLLIPQARRRIARYGESDHIECHERFPDGHDGKTYAITVLFGIGSTRIPARSLETVAVALERAGLAIDTRCRSGTCGWCRSKLESGEVWQRPEGDGVRARDREVGYFHPCSAYPISDLTVRVFSRL
jgi:ferredoxin-NADP reductase/ferredoxin